jgi:hypothetical protein
MTVRVLTALFDEYEAAAQVVDDLEAAGIPHADISIVANRPGSDAAAPPAGRAARHPADAADGAGTGATVGTVLGGGAGLLAGLGLLAIPGLGPVIAAGWLVAAVTGAGVGAAAGGLIGGLTGAGLSEGDAETYAEGVRRGGTLVSAIPPPPGRREPGRARADVARPGRLDRPRRTRGRLAGAGLDRRHGRPGGGGIALTGRHRPLSATFSAGARPQVIILRANIAAPNRTPEPRVIREIISNRRGSRADSALTGSTIGLKNSICRAAIMRARSEAISTC